MALATFIGMILHGVLPNKTIGYGNGQLFESVEDDQNNG